MIKFTREDGTPSINVIDGEGICPDVNPFLHGCCDCGLMHSVAYMLVDAEGNGVPLPEGTQLALSFARDNHETARLRAHKKLLTKE